MSDLAPNPHPDLWKDINTLLCAHALAIDRLDMRIDTLQHDLDVRLCEVERRLKTLEEGAGTSLLPASPSSSQNGNLRKVVL